MKLIEGQLIHRRYRLDSRLAQGGMGEVWKGYDIQLGREVAIKALRSDMTNAEAKLRRLRAEAHNSANLAHPNIAALFEYYEHDGIGFLIMEYVPSKSLADLFHSKGAMDPIELLPILIQTARGLFVAHSHGVIHRDVKPANFLFTDSSQKRFVLTDWGFARMLDRNGRAVADDGRTKLYTAPELYINIPGQPTYVDPKADFFSMGMSLLALWKGEGLLIADEDKLVRQKLDEELPYPSHKEMSEHMLSLIKALTRNNPDKRAGFDEVKRWAKGEVIFKDSADHNSLKDYRIVFSGEKNLIARNNAELARIMWQNRELAKKYLYADRIAEWLEGVDRPEVAIHK